MVHVVLLQVEHFQNDWKTMNQQQFVQHLLLADSLVHHDGRFASR